MISGCAHKKTQDEVSINEASRLDKRLIRDAVVFEQGTKDGAIVPEISSPRIRAIWVPEKIESNGTRLIEAHREWILDGDVTLLGTPQKKEIN